jgi:hypothetical protein
LAEPAAEQRDVDRHIGGLQPELFCQLGAGRPWALRCRPGLAFAIGDADSGADRLHCRVREMRNVVFREDRLCGGGQSLVGVTLVAHDFARLAGGLFELRLVGGRIVTCMRPVIPMDDERLAPFDSRPGIARNNRDTADRLKFRRRRRSLDDNDLFDPRHLHCRGAVIGGELTAHHRRPRNDGIFHSG